VCYSSTRHPAYQWGGLRCLLGLVSVMRLLPGTLHQSLGTLRTGEACKAPVTGMVPLGASACTAAWHAVHPSHAGTVGNTTSVVTQW